MPRGRYEDYEEDEWHADGYIRRSLAPEPPRTRARSIGAQPAPNVYVYTSQRNDVDGGHGDDRDTYHDRRDSRGNLRGIEDRLRDIDQDLRRSNSNDRRGPSPYRNDMALALERERAERLAAERERTEREDELLRKKAELRRLREKLAREEEEARLKSIESDYKTKFELDRLRDEEKRKEAELRRKEEREKYLADVAREEALKKEERKRFLMEQERKEKEEQDREKELLAQWEAKKLAKAKADREAAEKAIADNEKRVAAEKAKADELRAKFAAEDEAKKAKEKAEKEAWRLKFKMEEEAEKAKKKKEEEEIAEAMHKKLAQFGFQENQIQAMIHPKKAENLPAGSLPNRPAVGLITGHTVPTYSKIHRDYIDIETLKFYGLPWEYDEVDSRYIVILQEMDERETEILFEHTRKLRSKTLLSIEDRGRDRHGHNEYAFVRRRAPSKSPSRKKETKKVSIFSLV